MRKIDLDINKIISLYTNGKSIIEISKIYECGETSVRSILNKLDNYNELKILNKNKTNNKSNNKTNNKSICKNKNCENKTDGKNTDFCGIHQSIINNQIIIDEIADCKIESTFIRKNNIYIKYINTDFFSIMIPKHNCLALACVDKYNDITKHSWHMHSNGYVECRINKKVVLLHRLVLNTYDKNIKVDHINRNKFDCRNYNLRIVSNSQNQINKKKMSNNTSGYVGVCWDKSRDKWHVMISFNNKNINLGRYDLLEDAITARLDAEKIYHKEFTPLERKEL